MRTKLMLRKTRPVQLGAGVALLAIPASAVALTAGSADAQSAIQINVNSHRVAYGRDVTVNGSATPAAAGQSLDLEFAPSGNSTWQMLGSTNARRDGTFRFNTTARHSGLVRVVPGSATSAGSTTFGANNSSPVSPSAAQTVSVAARFALTRAQLALTGGQRGHVRGKLLPAAAGRVVRLLGRSGGRWHTLSSARTGPRGGFSLPVSGGGSPERLRVSFAGDRYNAAASAGAGSVSSFQQVVASWYDDAGSTACGFHAQYGVANLSLPCGTQVQFRLGSRTVTAVVDDRGPYVGGRQFDLNQNTAGALGFSGVGAVWASY